MSELYPEPSIPAAGADPGTREAVAHEARGCIEYLLAELRCASLRARLLQADIDAVGLALKGGLITTEQALWHLEDIGIQRLFIEVAS